MKHDVFNQYVDRVANLFSLTREDIFSKSKKRSIVDARYLLYYLCYNRPMNISYIQKYLNEAGYMIEHSSIIHGISVVNQKMTDDRDYVSVVKELERAVYI